VSCFYSLIELSSFSRVFWLGRLSSTFTTGNLVEGEFHIPNQPIANVSNHQMDERANPSVKTRYKSLRLPSVLHCMPINYFKILPKFNGDNGITAEEHMQP